MRVSVAVDIDFVGQVLVPMPCSRFWRVEVVRADVGAGEETWRASARFSESGGNLQASSTYEDSGGHFKEMRVPFPGNEHLSILPGHAYHRGTCLHIAGGQIQT